MENYQLFYFIWIAIVIFWILGCIGNILCICVLLQKQMIKHPINILLLGLSISDICTILGYSVIFSHLFAQQYLDLDLILSSIFYPIMYFTFAGNVFPKF